MHNNTIYNHKNIFQFLINEFKKDINKNIFPKNINPNLLCFCEEIDYDFIVKDLDSIDDILKEQVNLEMDRVKKTNYYKIAENIYSNKINEIVRVLFDKLDEEDYALLESDIEEFQKNIDFAITNLDNTIESSVEFEFYKNKYLYEEKQKKCRDILETYKGFLK